MTYDRKSHMGSYTTNMINKQRSYYRSTKDTEDDKEIYMIYANSSKTSLWRTKRENIKYIRKISSCIITMVFG